MASTLAFVVLPLALVTQVLADLTPTAPGPGQTFDAGSACTIQWDVDQSGTWTNVTIDLMSGSNTNMSYVTNVAYGLDGTDATLTPFNWTCPEVDPYSAIYFYQFTNNGQAGDTKWTTRFAIASPNGETTLPSNASQPSGDPIPWGTGTLVSDDPDDTDADSDPDTNSEADTNTDPESSEDTDTDALTSDVFDKADIRHIEQIRPMNPIVLRKDAGDEGDSDDGDDSKGSGKKADKKHSGDDSSDDDSKDDGDDTGDDKGSHTSSAASSKGTKNAKTDSGDAEKTSSGTKSSVSHKPTTTPKTQDDTSGDDDSSSSVEPSSSSSKKTTHSTSSTSSPKGTAAVADSAASASEPVPTAGLPASTKNAHSTSSAGSISSVAKTSRAIDPSNTCSCSADTEGGLAKLAGGANKANKVSIWLQLAVPVVVALSFLC